MLSFAAPYIYIINIADAPNALVNNILALNIGNLHTCASEKTILTEHDYKQPTKTDGLTICVFKSSSAFPSVDVSTFATPSIRVRTDHSAVTACKKRSSMSAMLAPTTLEVEHDRPLCRIITFPILAMEVEEPSSITTSDSEPTQDDDVGIPAVDVRGRQDPKQALLPRSSSKHLPLRKPYRHHNRAFASRSGRHGRHERPSPTVQMNP